MISIISIIFLWHPEFFLLTCLACLYSANCTYIYTSPCDCRESVFLAGQKKGGLKVGHVWSCWSGFQIPPLNQLFLLPSVLFEDDKLTFAYAKLSEDVMPDKPITLWWLVQRCKPFMVCRYCKWLGRLHVSFGSVLEIAWLIWLRVVVAHIISSMFSHSF